MCDIFSSNMDLYFINVLDIEPKLCVGFFSMNDSAVKECPKSSAGFCHHRRVNQEWPERQCMLEEVNRSLSYCESAFWG